jgi:methionyl-tRNA formyltransferase
MQPAENNSTLTAKLININNEMLREYLPKYITGELKIHDQPSNVAASYTRKLTKSDSQIDWSKSAQQIDREIRAFIIWPRSKTTLLNIPVIITEAHPTDVSLDQGAVEVKDGSLLVGCGTGSLEISRLIVPGKSEMSAQSFIAGYATNKKAN